jgi:hypothetical protein
MNGKLGPVAPGASRWLTGSRRRTLARALLVIGAVYLGGMIARTLPRDQTLVFRIGAEPSAPRRLRVAWTRVGDSDASGGATLLIRTRPSEIRQHATLPNGDYVVTIEVDLKEESTRPDVNSAIGGETISEHRVTLRGGETIIRLGRAVPE